MEAIFAIWYRDIIKFLRDKAQLIGSLALPLLLLMVFGSGMGGAIKSMMSGANTAGAIKNFDFVQFMFPGIIAMTVFNTAVISALSVVQDREFGYLREMLVSPVSRTSIALGKVLGGSTIALIQGLLILLFIPLAGVKLTLPIIIKLIPAMFIVAFTVSGLGLFVASFIKTSQGFHVAIQLLIFPMLFLSGALFPLNGIPSWMNFLIKINPMTYAVDMFKKIILQAETMDPVLRQAMGLNLQVFNYPLTILR
ncbi:ABC transporter permease [Clostridium polynesiense]|uniref:ABC transporter permease n=1 Tax=Clostridium polynesiense TaxID=1325933 RepID=UPI00069443A3|nr:ABC transporter permease [Clostridium polynesiense]